MADTFEVWCTPVIVGQTNLGKYADHTFVYCANKKSSFGCWGGSNRNAADAAKAWTAQGEKAFCKADKYRGILDSAWLGIYGINGVCHQSANLFLYPTNTCIPLNQDRPRGILSSYALYGAYGDIVAGDLNSCQGFFSAWLSAVYAQANLRCKISFFGLNNLTMKGITPNAPSSQPTLVDKIRSIHFDPLKALSIVATPEKNIIAKEFEVVLKHYIPELDCSSIKNTHVQILKQKEAIFEKFGLTHSINLHNMPSSIDVTGFVNQMNKLAIEIQKEVQTNIGASAYKKLTNEDQFFCPVRLDLAQKLLKQIGINVK